ncbi:MAG: o-succinylbenzoate synthase [Bacteroidota bacterium]
MQASYFQHILNFKRPSGTSRGILKTKETWFIRLIDSNYQGVGECGLLRTLSIDDRPDYEEKLAWACQNIHLGEDKLLEELDDFPSIQMGLETAFLSLKAAKITNKYEVFPSDFTQGKAGMKINGLIWMGDFDYMKKQIQQKIEAGFSCIKLKIGAIDFEEELKLLTSIRNEFSSKDIELRVDANGAFGFDVALNRLQRLSKLDLHSIEQPIKPGNWQQMADLCQKTPLPIALDEELIGIRQKGEKRELLEEIQPQHIILKPSLLGGFSKTQEWIDLAESKNISWWITSALESNIGLNAISQFTYTKQPIIPQGLGTGSLYTNNIASPLEIKGEEIWYNPSLNWGELPLK